MDTKYCEAVNLSPAELRQQMSRSPVFLQELESSLKDFLPDHEDPPIALGEPDSFGWTEPVMLPSKKAAAAVVAAAAAVMPAVPSRKR